MRKNLINKRKAGKYNPVKDQTAGSLSPPPAILSCLNFSPILYIYSLARLCSHLSLFLLTFLTRILGNCTFTFNIHFWFCLFPPSSPIFHLLFDFMAAISLIWLFPFSPCPTVPRHPPSLLSSAELNGD